MNTRIHHTCAAAASLLLALVMCAASKTVSGQEITVRNKVTLEPVSSVLLYHAPSGFYELTDEQGKVSVEPERLPDTIFIQHQSYVQEVVSRDRLEKNGYVVFLTEKVVLIEEVLVTASKSWEPVSEVSNQVRIITENEIRFRNPQTTADLLAQTGEVYIQKSQMGGGSPVLRGFEANKVLLVVDGVRMNNAIYRSGHLQNSITLDHSVLERTEVVFGPGAVMYGSDAIGGVMHFVTVTPMVTWEKGTSNIKLNAYSRLGSANFEKTGHAGLNMGWARLGSYTAFTYSDFDDLRMGAVRAHGFNEWARSDHYVGQVDGRDTVLANPSPLRQRYSAYSQWNLIQKLRAEVGRSLSLGLNIQASSSSDIPRYEELNDFEERDGELVPRKFAEWYYGPQKRLLTAASARWKDRRLADAASLTAAYQRLEESRLKRKFRDHEKTFNTETVRVASFNGDFSKSINEENTVRYGFEAVYNHVASRAEVLDHSSGLTLPIPEPTRYPDGGSHTQSYAFYIMDKWKPGEQLVLQAGIRYSHYVLRSSFSDTSFIRLPAPTFHLSRGAISGSAGMVFKPAEGLELKAGISSGFRAPNVDDYGKVREKDGEVTIPNLDLKPEYAYNFEAGIIKNFDNIARLSLTGFYTYLADAIVRIHTTANGSDSILYQGDSAYIITNANIRHARVYGLSGAFYTDIGRYVSMTANFTYTRGREAPQGIPMAHIPPLFGRMSILAKLKRFQAECYIHYNSQKTLEEYSSSSEDRLEEATALGTPGWFTLNLRTTAQLHRSITLQAGVENILDHHYKPFASGISSAGRNFFVTLRVRV